VTGKCFPGLGNEKMNVIKANRNGSAIVYLLMLLAIAMILTASSARYIRLSSGKLQRMAGMSVAEERAAAAIERAKAVIASYDTDSEVLKEEGLDLKEEDWSVTVTYLSEAEKYEIVSTGRCARNEAMARKLWRYR